MPPCMISHDNTTFVLISFEGPDRYSLAGGLGVRVQGLASTLVEMGYPVHHFFIGDPYKKGAESSPCSKLTLYRWCQWISHYYPNGVYDGENDKLNDFNDSLPDFVVSNIIEKEVAKGKTVVILSEEWHTAEVVCRIKGLLQAKGIDDKTIIFWNANNTFGFDRIDWKRLSQNATITTVSRYMKHLMWDFGINPLVVPNGIHPNLLRDVDKNQCRKLRNKFTPKTLLSKVARWDPDKRWNSTVEAVARLKEKGQQVVLLARGGIESHGNEVLANAQSLGLKVKSVTSKKDSIEGYLAALEEAGSFDVLDVKFHIPHSFLRTIYHTSDAVLANSGHEPFGLVGLETMAASGMAFTGGTGEDYAIPYYNSIVIETNDPAEIEEHVLYIKQNPGEDNRMRKSARLTAGYFTWSGAVSNLIRKLEYLGLIKGIFSYRELAYITEDTLINIEKMSFNEKVPTGGLNLPLNKPVSAKSMPALISGMS